MNAQQFKDRLTNVNTNRLCIKFLVNRVLSDNYRGLHLVQHTRYSYEQLIGHIKGLKKRFGTNLVQLRTQDLSKRRENIPEEYPYRDYVSEMRTLYGQGTQDTIRKNNFVDYHRMRIINRYKKDRSPVDGFYNGQKRFASISKLGENLISQENKYDERAIYLRCLSNLLGDIPNVMREISINQERKYYTAEEYMFFISYLGANTDFDSHKYTKEEIENFLIEWGEMPKTEKVTVKNIIKEYCNPKNFIGNKISKRDYHNWKNNVQSIFLHLGRTTYFESNEPYSILNSREIKSNKGQIKMKRSYEAKKQYFTKHKIEKKQGFELHHTYPLFFHENELQWDLIDSWDNLIYIDAYSHAKITQLGDNCPVTLSIDNNNDITFKHQSDENKDVFCKYNEQVVYNPSLSDRLLKKNKELIKIN